MEAFMIMYEGIRLKKEIGKINGQKKRQKGTGHKEMVSGRFGGSDRSPETEALK